jgi:hypothetical protein
MLHLFDKPEPGPNLDEWLEQNDLWAGTVRPTDYNPDPDEKIWVMGTFDHTEKGPDAQSVSVYRNPQAALWDIWLDFCDTARSDPDFYSGSELLDFVAGEWEKLQNLRDDGYHFDGDFTYTLREVPVY